MLIGVIPPKFTWPQQEVTHNYYFCQLYVFIIYVTFVYINQNLLEELPTVFSPYIRRGPAQDDPYDLVLLYASKIIYLS